MDYIIILILIVIGFVISFCIGKEEGRDESVNYVISCIFSKPADWIKILEKYIETGEIDQEETNDLFR